MMNSKKTSKITFIGGDMRQVRALCGIAASGAEVSAFGFNREILHKTDKSVEYLSELPQIHSDTHIFVLPLPYSTDGENLNAPFFDKKIPVTETVTALPRNSLLLAGRADERLAAAAEARNIRLIDYFMREELMTLNAVPTAEGAIQIAMSETPRTLNGSSCLVVGNGRIGKILSHMLYGIGARVTVAARKLGDLASARSLGYSAASLNSLKNVLSDFDIIFNTIPCIIFTEAELKNIKKGALFIDLASSPGGADTAVAAREGIRIIRALSLPGKVAPDTAGDIIKDTVLNILAEVENS